MDVTVTFDDSRSNRYRDTLAAHIVVDNDRCRTTEDGPSGKRQNAFRHFCLKIAQELRCRQKPPTVDLIGFGNIGFFPALSSSDNYMSICVVNEYSRPPLGAAKVKRRRRGDKRHRHKAGLQKSGGR